MLRNPRTTVTSQTIVPNVTAATAIAMRGYQCASSRWTTTSSTDDSPIRIQIIGAIDL